MVARLAVFFVLLVLSACEASDIDAARRSESRAQTTPTEVRPAGRFDGLTITLELKGSTVGSGDRVQSFLDIRNDSGHAITDPSCLLASGRFALVPADDADGELWQQIVVDCGGPFEIPSGFIDRRSGPTFIARTAQGDPLPPGDYVATLEITGLSERLTAPIEVTE